MEVYGPLFITNATNASTYTTGTTIGGWTTGVPVYVNGPAPQLPRPQTALEWLDAEIEATCARGRLATG